MPDPTPPRQTPENPSGSLWGEGGGAWRDPLPPREVPKEWVPSQERLAARQQRSESRAGAFNTRVGAGVLSKRVR